MGFYFGRREYNGERQVWDGKIGIFVISGQDQE